ncbi:hypothetical protein [Microbulbifer epialgicus]|uniref:DUF3310 domain-containing protein n=1 Tax=Microbulbifer epialgicus TaxID=393907 RepID=A0ABV4P1G9_9GAMM
MRFKKGDEVKVVRSGKGSPYWNMTKESMVGDGKPYAVVNIDDDEPTVRLNVGWFHSHCLELVEDEPESADEVAVEETPEPTFKVGDKVRITHKVRYWEDNCWVPSMDASIGCVGTIESTRERGDFYITPFGKCYPPECLELVTDEPGEHAEELISEEVTEDSSETVKPSPAPRKTLDDCSPEEWDAASRSVRGIESTPSPESDAPSDTSRGAYVVQEGGSHYKKLAIQPMQYSMANGLDACQHTIVKYVTRHEDKAGIADLRKARHTLEILAQEKYGEAL